MTAYRTFSTKETPQTEKALPIQKQNSAGGFTFVIDDNARLRRFLILGSDANTYYTNSSALTKDNAKLIVTMASDGRSKQLVDQIVDVSTHGLAPKNEPAIFALAIALSFGSDDDKRYAAAFIPKVCRTGTHLFSFVTYVKQFRGWGPVLRQGVANWYLDKNPDALMYQVAKYRSRNGWSHQDVLRLAHPRGVGQTASVFDWICKRGLNEELVGTRIEGLERASLPGADIPQIIREYGLTWEMLPTTVLNNPETWVALFEGGNLPQAALIRQLSRMTRLGLLPYRGGLTDAVSARLTDQRAIKSSLVHPISILLSMKGYATGHSKGGEKWTPNDQITKALDDAFYLAFDNVAPSGKRTLIALDVSGSMGSSIINNTNLSAREASAALALVQMRSEDTVSVVGFTSGHGSSRHAASFGLSPLSIDPSQRLSEAVYRVSRLPFGATDCAAPMLHAIHYNLDFDTFVVYTDNETYAGYSHPYQALEEYRNRSGIGAKLVVVGMTATESSIANPNDTGMLDVVGFDASAPNIINNFSRGTL